MDRLRFVFMGTFVLLLAGCAQSPAAVQRMFVTDHGLGPDKWATAWLLTRQVAPGAALKVVDFGEPLPEGTAFDVPHSPLRRQGNQATFEVTRDVHAISDPDVERLAQIVHDIEVSFWAPEKIPESPLVEQAFRALQRRPGTGQVPSECYLTFFDSVYSALRVQRTTGNAMSMGDLAVDCPAAMLASPGNALVPEMPISELLAEMKRGKSVIFVDVREPGEFVENHIPGAYNITLRDLGPKAVSRVQHADYVVSYCVKDFRGFEMAKALREAGVANAVILNPYGIKGWIAAGLPTTGTKALGEAEARARFADCVDSNGRCAPSLSMRQ